MNEPPRLVPVSSRALFHLALAGIFLPVLSLPVVWLLALLAAARPDRRPEDAPWARGLLALSVVDLLVAAGVVLILLNPHRLPQPPDPPRAVIGVVLDEEARVRSVVPDGPADLAGLRAGDRIVAVDGERVAKPADLQARLEPGADRTLTVERAGGTLMLVVTPAAPPKRGLFEPLPAAGDDADLTPWAWAAAIALAVIVATVARSRRVLVWIVFAALLAASMLAPVLVTPLAARALGGMSIGLALLALLFQSAVMLSLSLAAMKLRPAPAPPPGPRYSSSRTFFLGAYYLLTGVLRVGVLLAVLDAFVVRQGLPFSNPIAALAAMDLGVLGVVLLVSAVAIVGPAAEEVLFRGFLLPRVGTGTAWAVASSAAVFAVVHPHYGLFVGIPFYYGLVLGWARVRSGGLAAPIALHALINGVVLARILIWG